MTRMTDDQLDGAISRFLGWRAERLDGVPDAQGMAWRLAGSGFAPRPRWQRTIAGLALVGLLVVALVGAAIIASRPPAPIGPLANGPLVLANALGWNGIDPASGAAVQLEPCDGQCEEAMDPRLSADGRTVFFVDPTPEDGDLRSDQPGWAIWRWDRLDGSVRRVVGCDEPVCTLRRPIPSPDGRYLAYGQGDDAPNIPMPPLDEVVIVDAETGREVRRFQDLIADGWWWEYPNFAWGADGQLLVTNFGPDALGYRRIDVTTGAEADVTLPQDGLIETSPDGTTTLMTTGDPDPFRVWILDDRFEHTRLLWEGGHHWAASTWSPDGTRFAGQTSSVAPPPQNMVHELQVVDIATGTVTTHVDDDAVGGQLLWLPRD